MSCVVKGKLLVDGTGAAPIENGAVVVEGEKITWVGKFAELKVPPGAEIVDVGAETIMPGLVEAHGHVSLTPTFADYGVKMLDPDPVLLLRAVRNTRQDFVAGITTIRLLGEKNFLDFALLDAIEGGVLPGPRLIPAGLGIKSSAGHGFVGTEFDGVEAIRKAIRANVRKGAGVIKLFITGIMKYGTADHCYYSREEIFAAVEEAHLHGKPVAIHCYGGPGLKYCIEAGVQTVEHAGLATDEELALMAKKGIWFGATFGPVFLPRMMDHAGSPEAKAKLEKNRAIYKETFLRAVKKGVKYFAGTDGNHGDLWFEAKCLVDFGLQPMDAIRAITQWAADGCNVLDKVGTLEKGKYADIISVKGNPLQDVSVLANVGLIMKGGQRYDWLSKA